ncbi:micromolar calcium activated neutral protease 1 (capn1) [Fusarium agapanthi]|uniref:Micromolar calcium activated neutral protease 1 (Capn1) n=1 Tax=Fusarium agapanthi TaxID=1803897 RepID=A0A9P5BBS4_9HYPO|nr:micromolar calcium activated neutral protease 1 (capn1) [Fusarium agapanthi]
MSLSAVFLGVADLGDRSKVTPQQAIDKFWKQFTTKNPGKATTVIPSNTYTDLAAKRGNQVTLNNPSILRRRCSDMPRQSRKYLDLKLYRNDCLHSLSNVENYQPGEDLRPESVKRVGEIFEKACFYIDGPTAKDVRQGRDGDCWLMAALCTLSEKPGLIECLCVAHDQDVGVYGFVFYRDGAWISEIVDDLCQHPQETWLPLLEKCYAKAHGDYGAIEGSFGGEGIEDLTGGVTSELLTTDILDKEYFWKEELLKVNQEFLFGCNTGIWGRGWGERKGIVELHAYSIQKAVEIDGKRLLKLKNPWRKGEWTGPWRRTGDGSKEWTAEWLQKLDHRFGDDGDFWISYEDLLRKYQAFERTRLFTDDWRVSQLWTTLSVPWALDYHDTHFSFTLSKSGPVGSRGQYMFELGFRLHKAGHSDYVVRSQTPYRMARSVNFELELEAGDYEVRVKINATRNQDILPIEKVIKDNAKSRREKLLRIGLAYDLGHCKGRFVETPEEKAARKEHEAKIKQKKRDRIKAKLLKEREEAHYLAIRQFERDEHKRLKRKEKLALKKAAKKARQEARKAERAAVKAEKAAKKAAEAEAKAKFEAEEAAKKEEEETEAAKEEKVEAGEEKAESKPEEPMTPESTADDDSNEKEEAKEAEAAEPKVDEKGAEADAESVGTLATLADRELWIHVDNYTGTISFDSDSDNESTTSSSSSSSEAEKDPWNAVVVAGIRIPHTGLGEGEDDGDINLKVIRPIPFGKDDEEVDVGKKCSTKVLDVDDNAKDATLVGDAREKIRLIKGDGAKRRTATTFF